LPTIEDKLLFILVYLKQNPTQTLHGYLFGMSQTNVNKWYQLLHTVLNNTLAAHGALPDREMIIDVDNDVNIPPHSDNTTSDDMDGVLEVDAASTNDTLFFSMMGQNDQ
jgi:hypothetical protein